MISVDPRLQQDSHALQQWQGCDIRLHGNASIPWVIIVPAVEVTEFCDLEADWQLKITRLGQCIGQHFKDHLGSEKINFAAIGNVVKQLHIHVIGRHENDPLWPDVVWGNPLPERAYNPADVSRWQRDLGHILETLK